MKTIIIILLSSGLINVAYAVTDSVCFGDCYAKGYMNGTCEKMCSY